MKKFYRIWVVLATSYLISQVGLTYLVERYVGLNAEMWGHFAIVPLFQAAVVLWVIPNKTGAFPFQLSKNQNQQK